MVGIKHLSEIYKKQGSEFLDNLFSRDVSVTEKLNGMSFSFERSIFDGTIYFYKRDQNNPISKIDRVLMQQYEDPIFHIKNLPESVISEIPGGWRFGMEFFLNNSPVSIAYQRSPKNGLVLTHIIVKNEFGDVERTIVDKEELDYWADMIDVEAPPIIFQGKLSDEQKVSINDFISSPNDILKQEHGTSSFAKYLISILNPNINKTALNDSLDEPIEGIVFRFGHLDGTGESFTAKILDPIFDDITKQNNLKKSNYFPNDIYGISIIEVMNFILDMGVDTFPYAGEDPIDKYISYICSVFNDFVEENGEKYLGLDFQEPDYLKTDISSDNLDLIDNEKTKELISTEESYRSLFKLVLSAFRKLKKKEGGFFTKGAVEQFNILVREISEYLNKESIVIESAIPTFDQFRKVKKVFSPMEEEPESEEPVEMDPSQEDIQDNMENILSRGSDTEGEPVNIIIGKFNPFHNGHLKLIKKANQNNNLPVCVFVVDNGRGFIDSDTKVKMMDLVSSDLSDIVKSVKFVDNDLLSTSVDSLDSKYYPKTLTVGKKRLDNYLLQSRALKKKEKLDKEFQIQTAPEWVTTHQINDIINDNDYVSFKNNVPKSIHPLWEEIKKCYNK
jgi:cytidyltransferase-like protein